MEGLGLCVLLHYPQGGEMKGEEELWLAREGGISTNGNIPNWHRTVNAEQPSEIYDLPQD